MERSPAKHLMRASRCGLMAMVTRCDLVVVLFVIFCRAWLSWQGAAAGSSWAPAPWHKHDRSLACTREYISMEFRKLVDSPGA